MPDDAQALYDHVLKGYQNQLATTHFDLLREKALSAQKDQRIADLTAQVNSKLVPPLPEPHCPKHCPPDAPKPGPR